MAELTPVQRLAQLRQRWERDPKSRVFLQLAEEYRRAGRLSEAVRILESGLAVHPGYVAAQVVLGRCLMDTGDAARAAQVLERAVTQDPTQLVANRLLVEAYLSDGNTRKARERLDLYRILNDRDVEIAQLEERIVALGGPAATAVARPKAPPRYPTREPISEAAPAVFDPAPREASPSEPLISESGTSPVSGRAEPFGRIRRPGDANRILATIAAAGIFPVALRRAAIAAPPIRRWEAPEAPLAVGEMLEPAEGAFVPEAAPEAAWAVEAPSPAPFAMEWSEVETGVSDEVPEAVPESAAIVPDSATATATLGGLYLAQGHLADAEESFEAVLSANPDDAAALSGLAEVRRRRVEAEAAFLDEAPAPSAPAAFVGGLTSRKVEILRDFLTRIRRGAQPHVS